MISQLRLDDVEHSIIGDAKRHGISGGQRKRVNIAMELMADPTILFCDEPTSGLDAANSLLVMAMLRSLSSRGLTIMAVIHQPRVEIYEQLHQVLLLGRGGFTAYHGDANSPSTTFGPRLRRNDAQNPADFLIDVVGGTYPQRTRRTRLRRRRGDDGTVVHGRRHLWRRRGRRRAAAGRLRRATCCRDLRRPTRAMNSRAAKRRRASS